MYIQIRIPKRLKHFLKSQLKLLRINYVFLCICPKNLLKLTLLEENLTAFTFNMLANAKISPLMAF